MAKKATPEPTAPAPEKEGLRIIELKAENIKRLKAVDIKADGNSVQIKGKNGQGKTSVIDAIWFALQYSEASKTNSQPVRRGEEKASIEINLGQYIVKRHWTSAENSYLEVRNADGFSASSPQKLLDSLIGDLSFDPLDFVNMKPAEQLKTLLSLVKLDINLDELAMQRKSIFEDRTRVNSKVKDLTSQVNAIVVPEGTPDGVIVVDDLLNELNKVDKHIRDNNDVRNKLKISESEYNSFVLNYRNKEQNLERMFQEYNKEKESVAEMYQLMQAKKESVETEKLSVEKLVDPDRSAIQDKLSTASVINQGVEKKLQKRKLQNQLTEENTLADDLTFKLKKIDETKVGAIQKANFPLAGLGFGDNEVTFNDVPFAQLSTAEQLKISISMAMSLNPKLKVILIREASMFDDDNLALIKQLAEDRGYQLWIEKVASKGDGVSVFIEDGAITSGTQAVLIPEEKKD